MKKYTQEELNIILDKHYKWLLSVVGGERADLSYANLSYANLSSANLSSANLSYANLTSANLSSANLSYANLSSANLGYANLSCANLSSANLSSANLSYANLSYANIKDNKNIYRPFQICPTEGSFVAWKAVRGHILKIEIPAKAKRTSSMVGRKCRASYVKTLEAWDKNGVSVKGEFIGKHDNKTVYKIGRLTKPDKYDDNPLIECTNGIHFFMTREEAENWM